MPIYEFYCPGTNKVYSFFARSLSLGDRIPCCPDNPDLPMEKVVSTFAVTGRTREGEEAGEAVEDPRMEAAMAEMEREFSSIDESNPDPRQIAHLMRRMTDLTGEQLPEAMKEMVERMEKGEDPEKLEEEYGDALEDSMGMEGEEGDNGPDFSAARKILRRTRTPQRDPKLYEMSDYL